MGTKTKRIKEGLPNDGMKLFHWPPKQIQEVLLVVGLYGMRCAVEASCFYVEVEGVRFGPGWARDITGNLMGLG